MRQLIPHNYKSPLLITLLVIVLVFLIVLISQDYNRQLIVNQLPENQKLKSSDEKIISFAEYPDKNSNTESIIQYIYTTEIKVPEGEYQGLKEDVSKRTPSSQSFIKEIKKIDNDQEKITYVSKFYSGTTFSQADNHWFYTESATTTKTAFLQQAQPTLVEQVKEIFIAPAFAAVNTTYAGAGDGFIGYDNAESWSTTHGAATGYFTSYTLTNLNMYIEEYSTSNYAINRIFIPFDTSTLDDAVVITAATLNVLPYGKINQINDAYDFLTVVQTTQASNTVLVNADYDQAGAVTNPTEAVDVGGRKDITSISTGTYLTFNLNATGLTYVSKTGYTKLGLREGHDTLNNSSFNNAYNEVTIYASEQTGTAQDPYLEVTYSVFSSVKIDGGRLKIDGGRLKIN